ncbi:MAG: PhoH family protein [Thermoanaerobacterales bacterium]|nr:PhoH family protein [Bacillota bacterium]MDI6905984.1 PhoH family protein [Thermoanaerobacterales bacterium]
MAEQQVEKRFAIDDPQAAAAIFGQYDEYLSLLEDETGTRIVQRGGEVVLMGPSPRVAEAQEILEQLTTFYRERRNLTVQDVRYVIHSVREGREGLGDLAREVIITTPRGKKIRPKTLGQMRYVQAIREKDIVFAIGPAGTGKTYLAVVMAVRALRNKEINRLILTRPAVEAGEKLGFLPGDLQEKVDPYLRPLYDALYDILGLENTQRYLDRHIIEIAPLAYMRGRTLEDAFIILDEAQNTTPEQMKMFLTRLGFGSKAVVTGDVTQVDLPKGQASGLVDAQRILTGVEGIAFAYFTGADTIRHPLVIEIVRAYERAGDAAEE